MTKIAYLSATNFADCDLPLLQELQKIADVTYILEVTERAKKRTLIDIKQLKQKGGLYPATDYPELHHIGRYVDINKAYVLNLPGLKGYSLQNIMGYIRLLSFLKEQQIDILHVTWPPRYTAFPLYCIRDRMIITMHDPLPHSSETDLMNLFHRKMAIRLIPNFILLNNSQREEFISTYGIKPNHVFQSQLSIYRHLQDTRPQLPAIEPGYVLFIGSINTHKGIEYLCEAMQIIHKQHPDLHLVVAGSGKLYFDSLPYEECGILTLINRYLSNEELVGFITQARCVVCPYVDATQSGVVMSAFSLGVPVIVTNVGGLVEMVTDGRYGYVVPPRDSTSLAEAISRLCLDSEIEQSMRKNIQRDFSEGSRSWHQIAKDMLNIYNSILS